MNTIGVLTTQNVLLKHKVANVGERILATIIDSLIIFAYYIFIYYTVQYSPSLYAGSVYFYLFMLPIAFYYPVSEVFMNGQSLGKKWIGLQVVKIDGSQPTVANYIIRWIFRLIDVSFTAGILAIIVISSNNKGQRIGDIVGKTMVVNTRKKESLDNTIHVNLDENHIVTYSMVELLNDSDIAIVKEVINLYKKDMSSKKTSSIVHKTAEAISKKINTDVMHSPYEFLNIIIKDYNFIHKF